MSACDCAFARTLLLGVMLFACFPISALPARAADAVPDGDETRAAMTLRDVFGDTVEARRLEQSLAPYLTVAETNRVLLEPLPGASSNRPAYSLGPDMVVLRWAPLAEEVTITLPQGYWVNFWTGAQSMGGTAFTTELAAGALPIWVRGGSVIERRSGGYDGYFERRLTDVAKACGGQCLVDLMPAFPEDGTVVTKDADGRTLTRSSGGLTVEGKAARMTVRWRFAGVTEVRVNGMPVPVQRSPEGVYASFDHSERSTVEWTARSAMPRSY